MAGFELGWRARRRDRAPAPRAPAGRPGRAGRCSWNTKAGARLGWSGCVPGIWCPSDNDPREQPGSARCLRRLWCSLRTGSCPGLRPDRRCVRGTPKRAHGWDGVGAFPASGVRRTTIPGSGRGALGACGGFGVRCARGRGSGCARPRFGTAPGPRRSGRAAAGRAALGRWLARRTAETEPRWNARPRAYRSPSRDSSSGIDSPARSRRKAASSTTGTPSSVARASFDPAPGPATTRSVFRLTDPAG